jgi:hypothetical protein
MNAFVIFLDSCRSSAVLRWSLHSCCITRRQNSVNGEAVAVASAEDDTGSTEGGKDGTAEVMGVGGVAGGER